MVKNRTLVSTITGKQFPFEKRAEFTETGESLEVRIQGIDRAKVRHGETVWERFADFFPFEFRQASSLGEGGTPLLLSHQLAEYVGVDSLFLKNETLNPTWSFKDRGSLACVLMAQEMGERHLAVISTGNMGASIAAYGARASLRSLIFIPPHCPEEKIQSMAIHNAAIFRVHAPDFGLMKKRLLELSESLGIRMVSGNGPIRVEGYKSSAFELYEQFGRSIPDFIAVPTSACGHIRGIFKGFKELFEARLIDRLPRMIIVQAARNSPLVSAFKQGKKEPIPFTDIHTVATAITTGNPLGGGEILDKASTHNWLAEDVSEEEILLGQALLGRSGFFVEPSSATSLLAIKKLVLAGKIRREESVVMVLTGSGLKDREGLRRQPINLIDSRLETIEEDIQKAF